MTMLRTCVIVAALFASPALAQSGSSQSGPGQADLDVAIHRGGIATLAPLCGLRDQSWSEDLRKAAIQDATRSRAPDEQALKSAPGSDLAVGALGFADAEALEDFAEVSPETACGKLAQDPALPDADRRVATYRHDVAQATQHVW